MLVQRRQAELEVLLVLNSPSQLAEDHRMLQLKVQLKLQSQQLLQAVDHLKPLIKV